MFIYVLFLSDGISQRLCVSILLCIIFLYKRVVFGWVYITQRFLRQHRKIFPEKKKDITTTRSSLRLLLFFSLAVMQLLFGNFMYAKEREIVAIEKDSIEERDFSKFFLFGLVERRYHRLRFLLFFSRVFLVFRHTAVFVIWNFWSGLVGS